MEMDFIINYDSQSRDYTDSVNIYECHIGYITLYRLLTPPFQKSKSILKRGVNMSQKCLMSQQNLVNVFLIKTSKNPKYIKGVWGRRPQKICLDKKSTLRKIFS